MTRSLNDAARSCFAVLVAALAVAAAAPVHAQDLPPGDQVEQEPTVEPTWKDSEEGRQLLERADEILEITRDFRGVGADQPVKKGLMLRDELRGVLRTRFEEDNDDGRLETEFQLMVRLGLVDPALDYERFLLDLLEEQIAGFYDDETRELYILEGQAPETLDTVMSHELFHAIQDQVWTIASVRGPEDGVTDRMIARIALIEGDASAVMLDFGLAGQGGGSFTDMPFLETAIRGLVAASSHGAEGVMAEAPLVVQESLIFPYIEGMLFVAAIKREGGWSAVDDVYLDPPESTEQVMHPERYLERDAPQWIDFELPVDVGRGFEQVYDDIQGELGILLYLKQHLTEQGADPNLARTAADGWDGDRTRLYRAGDGSHMIVQLVTMDSVQDAIELRDALDQVAGLRYPDARRSELSSSGGGGGAVLHDSDEYILVEQRGTDVLYVEGLSATREDDASRLQKLTETVWLTRASEPYPAMSTE